MQAIGGCTSTPFGILSIAQLTIYWGRSKSARIVNTVAVIGCSQLPASQPASLQASWGGGECTVCANHFVPENRIVAYTFCNTIVLE